MIAEYIPIAVLIILATILAVLVIVLGHLFGPKRPTEAKSMPYESTWLQFYSSCLILK
jgi:NADH:ubiquinone oxidoreductase subunit 3 (subunit A)